MLTEITIYICSGLCGQRSHYDKIENVTITYNYCDWPQERDMLMIVVCDAIKGAPSSPKEIDEASGR